MLRSPAGEPCSSGTPPGLVDPLSGDGMFEAFVSARLAAEATLRRARRPCRRASSPTTAPSRPRSGATPLPPGARSSRSTAFPRLAFELSKPTRRLAGRRERSSAAISALPARRRGVARGPLKALSGLAEARRNARAALPGEAGRRSLPRLRCPRADVPAERARRRRAGRQRAARRRPLGRDRLLDRHRLARRGRREGRRQPLPRAPPVQGHASYSAQEIAEIFDGLGGELNAATTREYTVVYARVMDEHLETALDVMTDMVFAPTLADLDSEREVVLEEIAMYEDAPQETVHDLITQATFGDHPLGRPVIGTRRRDLAASRGASIAALPPRALRRPEPRRGSGRQRRPRSARRALPADGREEGRRRPRGVPRQAAARRAAAAGASSSSRRTPSSTTSASALPRSPARTGGASRPRSSTASSAGRRRRGSSRRSARSAASPTPCTRSRRCTRIPARSGSTSAPARRTSPTCLEIVAAEIADVAGGGVGEAELPPGQGEPQGADHALDGIDVEPDEPPRQVGDHRLRAAVARPHPGRDRGGRRRRCRSARRDAARPRAALGGGDRPERGALPTRRSSASAPTSPRSQRSVRVLLFGRDGKVGSASSGRALRARPDTR